MGAWPQVYLELRNVFQYAEANYDTHWKHCKQGMEFLTDLLVTLPPAR